MVERKDQPIETSELFAFDVEKRRLQMDRELADLREKKSQADKRVFAASIEKEVLLKKLRTITEGPIEEVKAAQKAPEEKASNAKEQSHPGKKLNVYGYMKSPFTIADDFESAREKLIEGMGPHTDMKALQWRWTDFLKLFKDQPKFQNWVYNVAYLLWDQKSDDPQRDGLMMDAD